MDRQAEAFQGRAVMMTTRSVKEQLGLFRGVVTNLIIMVEKASSGFNRQRLTDLDEMLQLQKIVAAEISQLSNLLDEMLSKEQGVGREFSLKLESVLAHVQLMAEDIGEMIPVLRKQIKQGIPFSQRGISQTNELFEGQLEMLRVLADIFQTDNEVLKTFLRQEKGPSLCQQCIDFATAHEARLVEGLCLPHAAPIFLTLLDAVRNMARHGMEVAHLLMQDQRC
jgi:Na+/phosphate symporter